MNEFRIDITGIEAVKRAVDPAVFKAAAYRAINRTVTGLVTDISSTVREKYNIKKSDIDNRIKKKFATSYEELRGSVEVKSDPRSAIPLIMFNAIARQNIGTGSVKITRKGTKQMKNRTKTPGVTYKVMNRGGRGYSANAFIIRGGGSSKQVAYRTGPGKQGLHEKRVISPVGMIESRGGSVLQTIMQKGRERFLKNLQHEISRRQK